jgi:hypothetical protein
VMKARDFRCRVTARGLAAEITNRSDPAAIPRKTFPTSCSPRGRTSAASSHEVDQLGSTALGALKILLEAVEQPFPKSHPTWRNGARGHQHRSWLDPRLIGKRRRHPWRSAGT